MIKTILRPQHLAKEHRGSLMTTEDYAATVALLSPSDVSRERFQPNKRIPVYVKIVHPVRRIVVAVPLQAFLTDVCTLSEFGGCFLMDSPNDTWSTCEYVVPATLPVFDRMVVKDEL